MSPLANLVIGGFFIGLLVALAWVFIHLVAACVLQLACAVMHAWRALGAVRARVRRRFPRRLWIRGALAAPGIAAALLLSLQSIIPPAYPGPDPAVTGSCREKRVPCDEVRPYKEGMAAARMSDHWGFIGEDGRFVVAPLFPWVRDYCEGRAAVLHGNKWGFLDNKGGISVAFEYDGVRAFSDGLAPVAKGKRWGMIDRDGTVVVPLDYLGVSRTCDGRICAKTFDGATVWVDAGQVEAQPVLAKNAQY